MKISTRRNVALFDLDGVIIANPKETIGKGAISDHNFWLNHWNDWENAEIQTEITAMIQGLISANWQIIILTARPEDTRAVTEKLLTRAGIFVRPNMDGMTPLLSMHSNQPILVMYPTSGVITTSGAAWKQETVKGWVDSGMKVRFMVEDYRVNAEAVRAVVPVLLYESKRASQHLVGSCGHCGGLSSCWCPKAA